MNPTTIGKYIFFATMALAGVSFLLTVTAETEPPPNASVFVHSPDPERYAVTLTAWVASERIRAGDAFWIEYELRNGGSLASSAELEPLVSSAWAISGWEERTGERWTERAGDFVPRVTLRPGEARRFRASARVHSAGSLQLQTAYRYAVAGNAAESMHNVVIIGPVRVDSLTNSAGAALQALITTLLLPMLLSGLAWFLPYAEAKARREREKREAEVAEQNAQAHQTWNLLLPYSMQIGTKYYMPACSAVLALQREHDRRAATGNHRAVLHALLLFMRHMRDCRNETGGIHFKHRMGERMASGWFRAINKILNSEFPLLLRERVLDAISAQESFSAFQERFTDWKTRQAFAELEAVFDKWYRGSALRPARAFGEYLPMFQLFRAIMQFEVNRPLEMWYREAESPRDVREAWDALPPYVKEEWSELADETEEYVQQIEALHKG